MPVPFDGREFTFTNPDGTEFGVRGWGNQFTAIFETLDGYTVVKDPESGYYHYAVRSDDGDLVPSQVAVGLDSGRARIEIPKHLRPDPEAQRVRASAALATSDFSPRWESRRRERREVRQRSDPDAGRSQDEEPSPSAATPTGNLVGLCLLVQFPDVLGTFSTLDVADFCNQVGYSRFNNNGSVRDYFKDVSDGRVDFTNIVTAYYTAKNKRSYYTDPKQPYGKRTRQLIIEGLTDLKGHGFDFSGLTADKYGWVRSLSVFYAGPCINNWGEGLWPHAGNLPAPFFTPGGLRLLDYQICDIGEELTLQTFCHENGHMLFDFPDLYDYGRQSSGVGNYCLMCNGGAARNPVEPCAYLKREAGWVATESTAASGMCYELRSDRNDLLVHARSGTEYFVMENRERVGRDQMVPSEGLAIFHVDEAGSNDHEQMTPAEHYECSLEQADGLFDLEKKQNAGDVDDLFGAPRKTAFGAATSPNSRWWDGTPSGLEIKYISPPGPTMKVVLRSNWRTPRFSRVGGPASRIFASSGQLCATDPESGRVYHWMGQPAGAWKLAGGPGSDFVFAGKVLYGRSPDGSGVWRRTWISDGEHEGHFEWQKVRGPTGLLLTDGSHVFATGPRAPGSDSYPNLSQFVGPWKGISGPAKTFAVGFQPHKILPDGNVERWDGSNWVSLGAPQGVDLDTLYTGGKDVYGTFHLAPNRTGPIFKHTEAGWVIIGGSGKGFATDDHGGLYGISPADDSVWLWEGDPHRWTNLHFAAQEIVATGDRMLFGVANVEKTVWQFMPDLDLSLSDWCYDWDPGVIRFFGIVVNKAAFASNRADKAKVSLEFTMNDGTTKTQSKVFELDQNGLGPCQKAIVGPVAFPFGEKCRYYVGTLKVSHPDNAEPSHSSYEPSHEERIAGLLGSRFRPGGDLAHRIRG